MEPNNTNDNQNGIETTQQLTQINADNSQPKEALSEEQPSESIFVQPEKSAEAQISDFSSKSEAEPSRLPQEQPTAKKERKLIKLLRIIVWLLVAIFLPIGAVLRDSAEKSISYANGTYQAKQEIGDLIFTISIIVFALNFIWGTVRWILRLKRKKCSIGRIIGKLIGGGIWRAAVFTPIVLFSLLFLSSFAIDKVSEMSFVEREQTSSEKISAAYANNEISADEYVSYTLSAAFDIESLPDKFKSQTIDYMSPDLTSFMDAHFDELSDETLVKFYEIYAMPNVRFGTDSSGNVSTKQNKNFLSSNVYAKSNNVITLDKAKLSPNEHFVIFYTNIGDSGVDDSFAQSIGEYLEKSVDGYKEKFGLEYKYEKASVTTFDTVDLLSPSTPLYSDTLKSAQDEVLRRSGISENIMNTTMPIYIINPSNHYSGTVAAYSSIETAKILQRILVEIGATRLGAWFFEIDDNTRDMMDFYGHVQSFPLIHINPNALEEDGFMSSAIVVSHELGHHYQSIICEWTCSSDKFITEGTANLFAININSDTATTNLLNDTHYNEWYLPHTEWPIDGIYKSPDSNGYASLMFFENIYETTNKNVQKIKEILQVNPESELTQVQNIVGGENYKIAMIRLSERNILNNYNPGLPISADSMPRGEALPCTDICSTITTTSHSSSNYIYFTKRDYINTTIKYSALSNHDVGSLLGKKKDRTWEIIYSGIDSFELDVSKQDEYIAYAFANTNYSPDQEGSFSVEVLNNEIKDIVETKNTLEEIYEEKEQTFIDQLLSEDASGENPLAFNLGNGCYGVDFNELLDIINEGQKEISSAFVELVEVIDEKDETNDYSDVVRQIQNDSAEADRNITEAQANLSNYDFTICKNYIKSSIGFDGAKARIKSAFNERFELGDIAEDGDRVSFFGGVNLIERSASLHALFDIDNELILYSFKSIEK